MSFSSKLLLSALSLSCLVAGCGADPVPASVCAPGVSVACVGAGACAGGQVCNATGSGYGVCDCGLPGDAGPADAGPADMSLDGAVDDLGAPDAGPAACLASPDYGVVTLVNPQADTTAGGDRIRFFADLSGAAAPDQVYLTLYPGFGVFATHAIVPGVYSIAGDDLNVATCGLCLSLQIAPGDTGPYIATGGTVTITSVTPNLAGTVSDVTFQHVDVDPDTFVSTPAPDACVSALAAMSFDSVVTVLP